jgi:CBS domain-containing protein
MKEQELMLQPGHPFRRAFDQLHAADAMHAGVVTCPLETPLREVARMMATYRIHAVIAFGDDPDAIPGPSLWGVISDLDLARAANAPDFEERTAGEIAATPLLMVSADETLARATQLMSEHEVTHLVVADRRSGRPIGVLSTLDVARALAGFP